jgi:hypothetical protein
MLWCSFILFFVHGLLVLSKKVLVAFLLKTIEFAAINSTQVKTNHEI